MKKRTLKELNRISVTEFKQAAKMPVVVVLDNVRSALNVGSAFRTGDAFLIEQLCLCGITATPPHREILKTAIGATAAVKWTHYKTTLEAVDVLRKDGFSILAVEQAHDSTALNQLQVDTDKKYALVFGNEVNGVSQAVMDEVDGCLEIPQYGTKHSLNISVSIGVTLWEFARQWPPVKLS